PHPLVPSGSEPLGTRSAHPAIHGGSRLFDDLPPLFERAGKLSEAERELAHSRRLHPSGSPQPVTVTTKRSVRVKSGDCLWAIAAKVLATDDPGRLDRYWKQIFAANRSVIGADPDRLLPGQVLELPRETSA
ncbi:MAG: LysM peptidoglycan-binding domain-containing protein, partial [Actinomycetota bacterium]